ncbi:hypothetical protein SAMN04488038_11514 [Solimonas aquatica]|uniref:Uncharacterized protein n=1 Tax=Solimonas aquatica TaxID=489703 RepID=A0A1H9L5J9_9GAMM|nr:hypothetical protein [Solimonas aquatica]SER06427.1 hypothetical protein SAMN04488038_11514 [Solimonas aquatica]
MKTGIAAGLTAVLRGHRVEDDPKVGDGAFSSAGFFGFHPWISAGRSSYGLIAGHDRSANTYAASVYGGRLSRKAYATGLSP